MHEPSTPSVGLAVVHLFCKPGPLVDRAAVLEAMEKAAGRGDQVVTAAMLGHKADLAVMALSEDQWSLRRLQSDLTSAGMEVVDSYVSLTELSEYAQGVPEEMRQARLHPELPPQDKPAFCFYPMSKKREGDDNWFSEEYDQCGRCR